MDMSDRGLAELAGHEGIVLSRYRDSKGIWTIGIGHTAAAGAPDPATSPPLTLAEAMALFRRDVAVYASAVEAAVRVPLATHEFDALVSFHYNTGAIARASAIDALNNGDKDECARRLMRYDKPPEIIARRQAEARLFREGIYAHIGRANVYTADASGRVLSGTGRSLDVLAALASAPAPADATLRRGDPRRGEVEALQRDLAALGLYRGRVDGLYGDGTAAAVTDFRRGVLFGPDVAAADPAVRTAVRALAAAKKET